MNLTLLTCNYNTSDLVVKLLQSVKNVCEELPKVVVINTSNEVDSYIPLHVEGIPYFNFHGGIHGEAVNLGFKKVKTRYVLLVDSDVIFLKDFKLPFQKFKESGAALMGNYVGDVAGKSLHPRIEPWYCFIDLDQLKRHKIDFFDRERTKESKNSDRVYDIGSTMLEDVIKAGLTVANVNLEGKYFKHYGGMSWHSAKFVDGGDDTDIDFGGTHGFPFFNELGKTRREMYERETEQLLGINIKDVFSYE